MSRVTGHGNGHSHGHGDGTSFGNMGPNNRQRTFLGETGLKVQQMEND